MRRDPTSVIQGQTAARHHAVDMRMPLQGLSPGMQNTEKADFGAETFGIGGHFQKRGSSSLEQQREQKFLVLPHQWDQSMGDAENDVEVSDRQQFLAPFSEPLLACVDLALWAVPIPA